MSMDGDKIEFTSQIIGGRCFSGKGHSTDLYLPSRDPLGFGDRRSKLCPLSPFSFTSRPVPRLGTALSMPPENRRCDPLQSRRVNSRKSSKVSNSSTAARISSRCASSRMSLVQTANFSLTSMGFR